MKSAGPLPAAVLPFAERLFARFPEVLISLGSAELGDHYELPPLPGAQMRLEEAGKYKLVQVRLRRRQPRRRSRGGDAADGSLSPFSKSRALAASRTRQEAPNGASGVPEPVPVPQLADSRCVPESQVVALPAAEKTELKRPPYSFNSDRFLRGQGNLGDPLFPQLVQDAVRPHAPTSSPLSSPPSASAAPAAGAWKPNLDSLKDAPDGSDGERFTGSIAARPSLRYRSGGNHDPGSPKMSSPGSHDPWDSDGLACSFASGTPGSRPLYPRPKQGRPQPTSPSPLLLPHPALSGDAANAASSGGTADGDGSTPGQDEVSASGSSEVGGHATSTAEPPTDFADAFPSLTVRTTTEGSDDPRRMSMGMASSGCGTDGDSVVAMGRPPSLPTLQDPILQGSLTERPSPSPYTGTPLRFRRNISVNINEDWRRRSDPGNQSEGSLTPSIEPPAVFMDFADALRDANQGRTPARSTKGICKPLPGAYANARTLFILDWDDTLCPTSWIRRILKEHMTDQFEWADEKENDWQYQIPAWFFQSLPEEPHIRVKIQELQTEVISFISLAQTLGVVCIVTNAVEGWVTKTTKKWLPELRSFIWGHGSRPPLAVLYGQKHYRRPEEGSAGASLDWVDDQGELTWWKAVAMLNALGCADDLYRVAPRGRGRYLSGGPASPQSPGRHPSPLTPTPPHSVLSSPACSPMISPQVPSTSTEMSTESLPRSEDETLQSVSWYDDHFAKRLQSVISIGDSVAEMRASVLATAMYNSVGGAEAITSGHGVPLECPLSPSFTCSRPFLDAPPPTRRPFSAPPPATADVTRPWVKNVRLLEAPSVDDMIRQLRDLRQVLPRIAASRCHMDVTPDQIQALSSTMPPVSPLDRSFRTQTV